MLKILSSEQQRSLDAATIKNEPISSIDLMERAAEKCFQWIRKRYNGKETPFYIFCGKGNNGGDGLAIARKLSQSGYNRVVLFIIENKKSESSDFETNLNRASHFNIKINLLSSEEDIQQIQISENGIVIDAIFGSGLSRPVKGFYSAVINFLNRLEVEKIAIDIPSGLYSNENSSNEGTIFRARHTLSFYAPKLSFMFAENEPFVGRFHILPIGLDKDFIARLKSFYHYLQKEDIKKRKKIRKNFSHKGSHGHALIYAGKYGMSGAAVLASKASVKIGAGLTDIAASRNINTVLQVAVPEVIFKVAGEENYIDELVDIKPYNAIAFGPGVGKNEATTKVLKLLIQECKMPLVIDADGLNILAENKTWLSFLSPNTILTPHPGEFDRLFGKNNNAEERLSLLKEMAQKLNCYIILKGAHTAIATSQGEIYFNSTGNAGLAKGGSGDTLTGMLVGLLAQGYNPLSACLMAVYFHGLAADIAIHSPTISIQSMTASDLLDNIGKAFNTL